MWEPADEFHELEDVLATRCFETKRPYGRSKLREATIEDGQNLVQTQRVDLQRMNGFERPELLYLENPLGAADAEIEAHFSYITVAQKATPSASER